MGRLVDEQLWQRLALFPFTVRKRGVRQACFHTLRVLGELMDRAIAGPSVIRINPTDCVCNHRCPMCAIQLHSAEVLRQHQQRDIRNRMRLEDYRRLLDSVPPGLREVNIVGGGEPFMHPDCLEIMKLVKARRLVGSLVTNGSLMDEVRSRAVVDMGWNDVRISVNAGDRETYRLVTGVDHFEILRRNVLAFTAYRKLIGVEPQCGLRFCCVIQKENIDSIPRLFDFAGETGVDSIEFDMMVPLDGSQGLTDKDKQHAWIVFKQAASQSSVPFNYDRVRCLLNADKYESKEAALQAAGSIAPAEISRPRCDPGARPLRKPFLVDKQCVVGFHQVFIRASGDVLPCCFSDEIMGNARQHDFRDIWYGGSFARFRKRVMNRSFPGYCHVASQSCAPEVLRNSNRRRKTSRLAKCVPLSETRQIAGDAVPPAPRDARIETPLWIDATDMGSGWKWVDWFGSFIESTGGWISHTEHGFVRCVGESTSSIWIWMPDMGWLWTSRTSYPYLYRQSDQAWLWYQLDSAGPRWFYNMAAGKWENR